MYANEALCTPCCIHLTTFDNRPCTVPALGFTVKFRAL
jgi:hypothetical protein